MTEDEKIKIRMEMSRDFKQGFEAGKAKTIDEIKELMKQYIELDSIKAFVEALSKLKEQKYD